MILVEKQCADESDIFSWDFEIASIVISVYLEHI